MQQATAPPGVKRKLAAILSADVKGYSRLMAADEEGTLRALRSHREAVEGLIATHRGRLFSSAGDGMVVHASTFGKPVVVVPIDGAGPFHNARRY